MKTTIPSFIALKQEPVRRANALIGSALHSPLRGRFLILIQLAWWASFAVTLIIFLLTIPPRYSQLLILGAENSIALADLGLSQYTFALLIGVIDGIAFLVFNFVAILIFLRKSQEWIGLLASLTLITTVFAIVRPTDALLFVDAPLRVPLLAILAIAAATMTIFIYIFPDGHFAPRWTRWIAFGLCAFAVYGLLDRVFTRPFRWPPAPLSPIIYLGILVGVFTQIYRYRRVSDGVQKQQMRWVVMGAAIAAVGLVAFEIVAPLLLPRIAFPGMPRVLYILIGAPLFYFAILQLPLALAVSIFRYRLWNIDLLISRTLVYVILTGMLTGMFAAIEVFTQDLFVIVTGAESRFATVISTLLVVAAFTPLKELIQHVVEHRYKYATDPVAKLASFTQLVEHRVSPLHPNQITRRFLIEAMNAFDAKGGAAYLDQPTESKLVAKLGAWDGEAAVCVPISSSDAAKCFGWVALDDRKDGISYSERERQAIENLAQKIAVALEEDASIVG